MSRVIYFFAFVITILTAWSCKDPVVEMAIFDVVPNIELVSLSSTEIVEFVDSLTIVLKYEDGDGDLGNSNPDVNSIFVKDGRLEMADEYYLGPLAPENANISITGTLNLKLSTTFLFGNGSEESTTFKIHLVDRDGNESNTIETEPITILKQ